MGRRPRFCPPLLSNRHREELVAEVVEKEVDGNVPPRMEVVAEVQLVPEVEVVGSNVSRPRSPRVVLSPRQRSMIRKSPRMMLSPRMSTFRSPLSRMVLSPLIHPRARSPSSSQGASTVNGSRGVLSEIDLNVAMCINADWNATAEEQGASTVNGSRGVLAEIDLNVPMCINADWNATAEEQVNLNIGLDHGQQEAAPPLDWIMVRRKEAPNEQRRAIFDSLLARARNGNLRGHETTEVSAEYHVSLRTVQRIWNRGKACLDQGQPVDVSSRKKTRCGRKMKEADVSSLSNLSILERTTLHDVAEHLGISTSKLHRMKRAGEIKRVSSTLKPLLTDKNKKDRLNWCIRMLEPRSIPHDPMFQGLFDYVYIDEKWFNITKKTLRYYSAPDEQQPIRTCKNKNYIPRLMILTVFARPRFDSNQICTFDGKIGCFPFVTYVAAQRSSANRPAGTIEMKPIDSVTKPVMREYLIEKVLPAIRAKWPREDIGKPIYIQQDNAKPHVSPNDIFFCEAAKKDGFDIRIVCQPANSPDLNILDLGFFNGIQSIQYKEATRTIEELVAAVDKAFQDYSVCKSNRIFLTLHGCMQEIMRIGGGNGYDIPHIRKAMLERQGRLPLQLKCDAALVNAVLAQL